MKKVYHHTKNIFEKLAGFTTAVLGNSVTFIGALVLVGIWLGNKQFYE